METDLSMVLQFLQREEKTIARYLNSLLASNTITEKEFHLFLEGMKCLPLTTRIDEGIFNFCLKASKHELEEISQKWPRCKQEKFKKFQFDFKSKCFLKLDSCDQQTLLEEKYFIFLVALFISSLSND